MLKGERGQITLFIILGLVLLLASTLLIYYQLSPKQKFIPYYEQVPIEVQPLKEFVTKCIDQTAKRAIQALAKQGGVINVSSFAAIPNSPTEGNALQIANNWKVPYWWHLSSSNNCRKCEFQEFIPKLYKEEDPENSAETQLANYVANNLKLCVGKFVEFRGMIVQEKSPEVEVSISPDAVHFNVLYPLVINVQGKVHDLSKFYLKQNVKLPKFYEVANAITNEEKTQKFLEIQSMELVTAYSGLDKKKLPPVSETLFTHKNLYWTTSAVKENLQNVLSSNMHLLRVKGAKNALEKKVNVKLPYNAVIKRVYESFQIATATEVPYETHFQYLNWPIYFSINDKGGILMPEEAAPQVLPIPLVIQRYSTVYDYSFPTLVELYDEDSEISFFFALEGNVRNNGPLDVNVTDYQTLQTDEGLLCNPLQRNTVNTTISVIDEQNNPVPGAVVSFSAGDTCMIGETDKRGILTAPFPIAIGVLSVQPIKGISQSIPFQTSLDVESEQKITLLTSKPFKAIMKVKQLVRENKWNIGSESELAQNDVVLLTLERIQDVGEGQFTQIINFNKDAQTQTVNLPSGTYNVKAIFMQELNITLQPQTKCFETGGGFLGLDKEEQCFQIPEEPTIVQAPPLVVETTLKLTSEDIKTGRELTFYAPKVDFSKAASYDDVFVDMESIDKSLFTPRK